MEKRKLSSTDISDAEWEIMRIVWTLNQAHTKEIISELQKKKSWSDSTIKTLIRRLTKKGLLEAKQDGRGFLYLPTVSQTEMMVDATQELLDRMCNMHKGEVIFNLVKDSPISKSDLEKIKVEIDKKLQTAPNMVACNCLSKES
ncbi:MAG: CopY/TcrY family copper transport repressor [Lactobacillus sp.]|nr:CopY/TcrY family copper transport repressor [Lactobacillus sp.]